MPKKHPTKTPLPAKNKVKIGVVPKVIAQAKVIGGGPASAVIRLRARDDKVKSFRIPRSEMYDRAKLMKRLADEDCIGLPLEADAQKALQKTLVAAEPTRTFAYSMTTGWVGNKFVLPDVVIGQQQADNPRIAYEAPEGRAWAKYGTLRTLEEWQEHVATPAGHSAVMVFAICMALAAPLLDVCGVESGGVHLTGKSSKGKSSTARVARSVSGPPELLNWFATVNGIEAACCAFNGTLMCIDETGALEGNEKDQAQKIRQTAFKIAGGVGKLRAGSAWNIEQSWRLFVLSSGEISLEVIAASSGGARLAGEQVRFPNLPCTLGKYGVFETLPAGYATSEPLANDLNQACLKFHGTAFRAFLSRLTREPDRAKAVIKSLMQEFYDYLPLGSGDGWERRFAEKFALTAAAGVLGVRWEVLPWSEERVMKAIKRCYRRARNAVPEAEQITKRGLEALDAVIGVPEKVVDLRKLSKAQRQSIKGKPSKGFLREWRDYGVHLAVRPDVFRGWFKESSQADLVLHELDKLGRLKRDGKRGLPTRQVQLWPGDKNKFRYLIITFPEPQP